MDSQTLRSFDSVLNPGTCVLERSRMGLVAIVEEEEVVFVGQNARGSNVEKICRMEPGLE